MFATEVLVSFTFGAVGGVVFMTILQLLHIQIHMPAKARLMQVKYRGQKMYAIKRKAWFKGPEYKSLKATSVDEWLPARSSYLFSECLTTDLTVALKKYEAEYIEEKEINIDKIMKSFTE